MSTDPYPEVSGDESGIVPPQNARTSEWPKKLRTLTAAELDRLTIDNSGRFYWDGKLVKYDTQPKQASEDTSDSLGRSLDILDRASQELGGRKSSPTIEGELAPRSDTSTVDLDLARPETAMMAEAAPAAHATRSSDPARLTLSRWQTIGAIVAVIGIAVGAFSMATYGYVAAREWGCKTGAFQSGCPAVPVVQPPARPDIPA